MYQYLSVVLVCLLDHGIHVLLRHGRSAAPVLLAAGTAGEIRLCEVGGLPLRRSVGNDLDPGEPILIRPRRSEVVARCRVSKKCVRLPVAVQIEIEAAFVSRFAIERHYLGIDGRVLHRGVAGTRILLLRLAEIVEQEL